MFKCIFAKLNMNTHFHTLHYNFVMPKFHFEFKISVINVIFLVFNLIVYYFVFI